MTVRTSIGFPPDILNKHLPLSERHSAADTPLTVIFFIAEENAAEVRPVVVLSRTSADTFTW
jgi:hypothetical protein